MCEVSLSLLSCSHSTNASSALICPSICVLPRDGHNNDHHNEPPIPIKLQDNAIVVASSGYHTLSEVPKPVALPKAKPATGTSFNAKPSASFVPKARQNGLSHDPSQLQDTPNGKPAELETNQQYTATPIGEEALFMQLGTTLLSPCRPFRDPDPGGGGEENVHHEHDELEDYLTPKGTWDIIKPKQATN